MWEEEAKGIRRDEEEALLDLIEQRTKNVEKIGRAIAYYTCELEQKEKNLEEAQQQLARLRAQAIVATSTSYHGNDLNLVKVERRSMSPIQISDDSSESLSECEPQPDKDNTVPLQKSSTLDKKLARPFQKNNDDSGKPPRAKPLLIIPDMKPKGSLHLKMEESSPTPCFSDSCAGGSVFSFRNTRIVRSKADKSVKTPPDTGAADIEHKGTKRKSEQIEHKELIPLIGRSSSASKLQCQTTSVIPSQHTRKLRNIVLCPTNDQLFASSLTQSSLTCSALDGVVNLWQVQDRGSSANLLSSTDCFTHKCKRWPEDVAWHPEGSSLFSVYRADEGDSQISILNLNKRKENMQVNFLEDKPHVKGIINNIEFMPWKEGCFVTGGCDHAVILWTNKDGEHSWKPKELHSQHSSAVMGVAGLQHKKVVMSAGADKRIFGFDLPAQRIGYKHQVESKCMSVLPNPCDLNLFMIQTGTLEKQLRLFDFRSREAETHSFGWKQESSDSHSALINQAWSPDGLYITSGSVDPAIHIFDIRYNSHEPCLSIRAHNRQVFKAVWHHALPVLISISSDLNIGFHKIV
ncbi:uncharacterized protein [Solanum tuberosum]|uniref:uncharacterized protein isoform X1 n=1 Tax=Solanum tuberosum TaxID=4113 RepID=UPI00073A4B0C|nr:PREDICTED: uncharacterized protein LOC102579586 isoform X1 [Solanum tuberosum]